MPTNDITQVNELAAGQPELLTFADQDSNKIGEVLKDIPSASSQNSSRDWGCRYDPRSGYHRNSKN